MTERFHESEAGDFIQSEGLTARSDADDTAAIVRAHPPLLPEGSFDAEQAFVRLTIEGARWRDTTDTPAWDATIREQIFDALVGEFAGENGTYEVEISDAYSSAQKAAAVNRISDTTLALRFDQLTPDFDYAALGRVQEALTWGALPADAAVPSGALTPQGGHLIVAVRYAYFESTDVFSQALPGDTFGGPFDGFCFGTGSCPFAGVLPFYEFEYHYPITYQTRVSNLFSSDWPATIWSWEFGPTIGPGQPMCCGGSVAARPLMRFPDGEHHGPGSDQQSWLSINALARYGRAVGVSSSGRTQYGDFKVLITLPTPE